MIYKNVHIVVGSYGNHPLWAEQTYFCPGLHSVEGIRVCQKAGCTIEGHGNDGEAELRDTFRVEKLA